MSHIFIEREIIGLRALGQEVVTFSARRPPENLPSELMRSEAASTIAIQADKGQVLRDNLNTLLKSPAGYLSSLRRASSTGERRVRSRVWQVFYLAEAARVYQEMREQGIRHLHAHFANNGADIARLVVELGRTIDGPDAGWSWSFTMHGSNEFEAVERYDLAAKVAAADGVACISDFTRSQLMRFTDPEEWGKLALVRMSVDTQRFSPPAADRSPTDPLRVLQVGRLVPEKGTPILIDALAALAREGIEVEARLVGDGPLRDSLAARVAAAGLSDQVEFVGVVGQDHILEHYHWANVFCLPSFQEGLPVVLMEAMATGLPVVTTRIAGIGELVVDGDNGRLLTPGRVDLVLDALRELATEPSLRVRMGDRGRATVASEFSLDSHAQRQYEFLQAVRKNP
ncbi:glycosyltransferase family 4 protein [Granulicoccus sp. GXG6511]|uniref:glycosyltransferase family 4 protein n=1 Tax=Granulicoccus sp. GXG6511 TaxID=3381351 RepID=UPI003D7DEE48